MPTSSNRCMLLEKKWVRNCSLRSSFTQCANHLLLLRLRSALPWRSMSLTTSLNSSHPVCPLRGDRWHDVRRWSRHPPRDPRIASRLAGIDSFGRVDWEYYDRVRDRKRRAVLGYPWRREQFRCHHLCHIPSSQRHQWSSGHEQRLRVSVHG